MYAGCVASAIDKNEYLSYIDKVGFKNVIIQKDKPIVVPDDILKDYLNDAEIAAYKSSETVIRSITIYAEKPAGNMIYVETAVSSCSSNTGCC